MYLKNFIFVFCLFVSFNIYSMVAVKETRWHSGQTITFIFMPKSDGTPISDDMQKFVSFYANEWTKFANLKFEFIDGSKLSFSEIIDRKNKPDFNALINFDDSMNPNHAAEETMAGQAIYNVNFNLSIDTSRHESNKDLTAATIIHEFGHLLGFLHEHQHPQRDFNFKSGGIKALCNSQGWNKRSCDQNIRKTLSGLSYKRTKYDRRSIMHYPLPSSLIDGEAINRNHYISHGDAMGAAELYPYDDLRMTDIIEKRATAAEIHARRIKYYEKNYNSGSTYRGGLATFIEDGKPKRRKNGFGIYIAHDDSTHYKGEYLSGEKHGFGVLYNRDKTTGELNYHIEGFMKKGRHDGCQYIEYGSGWGNKDKTRIIHHPKSGWGSSWSPLGDYSLGGIIYQPKTLDSGGKKYDSIYVGEMTDDPRFAHGCGYLEWFGKAIWKGSWEYGNNKKVSDIECKASNYRKAKKEILRCFRILPPHTKYGDNFIQYNKALFEKEL